MTTPSASQVLTMPQAQVAAQPKSGLKKFNELITSSRTQEYLSQVLGEKRHSFVNNLTALVANSTHLQSCTPTSVMYAAIKATALDLPLDPNLGQAYVIPYRDNKGGMTEAQFQIGYKGFIQLAQRSGLFRIINVTEIKEGELENFDLLTGTMRFRAKANRHELPAVGYVAHFELTNGFAKSLYMTREEVEAHALKFSQTFKSDKRGTSVWAQHFDAMAKKTVLKALLSHYAPMSVQMASAITSDQGVIQEDGTAQYVDNHVEDAVAEEVATSQASETLGFSSTESSGVAHESVNASTGEITDAIDTAKEEVTVDMPNVMF